MDESRGRVERAQGPHRTRLGARYGGGLGEQLADMIGHCRDAAAPVPLDPRLQHRILPLHQPAAQCFENRIFVAEITIECGRAQPCLSGDPVGRNAFDALFGEEQARDVEQPVISGSRAFLLRRRLGRDAHRARPRALTGQMATSVSPATT